MRLRRNPTYSSLKTVASGKQQWLTIYRSKIGTSLLEHRKLLIARNTEADLKQRGAEGARGYATPCIAAGLGRVFFVSSSQPSNDAGALFSEL